MRSRFLLVAGLLFAVAGCSSKESNTGTDTDGTLTDAKSDGTVPGEDAKLDLLGHNDLKPRPDTAVPDVSDDVGTKDLSTLDVQLVDTVDTTADIKPEDLKHDTTVGCGTGPACTDDQECCDLGTQFMCVALGQCESNPECQVDDDCGIGKKCCKANTGNLCKTSCGSTSFDCTIDTDCSDGMLCCDFFGQMKMCMPPDMCPGTPGGCVKDSDCTNGQVCCAFGEMAAQPTCMAAAMCPKECGSSADCTNGQECCDLETQKICIDPGQCPAKCLFNSECPLGQQCCDAGDGLLICVASSDCPQPVACTQGSVCTNQDGEPNGFECCDVPTVGFACVGFGGCGTWETCNANADCPKGRECCPTPDGSMCLPLSSCLGVAQYKECTTHDDCTPTDQICCLVPDLGTVCAKEADCPSECLKDADCGTDMECCMLPDNPAVCMQPGQCTVGQLCSSNTDCGAGQECCDLMGQKTCMPEGQCMGAACTADTDCPGGQKCCDTMGQKMCLVMCL